MIRLIIVEASLELVPKELIHTRAVINHAKRLGRKPEDTLLDKSYHYSVMKRLKDFHKRGRPDIVHITSLCVTSTPLYREGLIEFYIHTINGEVILLKNVRLPKTYLRFEGLIVDLFKKRKIEYNTMRLEILDSKLDELIKDRYVIGLSRLGEKSTPKEIAELAIKYDGVIIIGGFSKGHFSPYIVNKCNKLYSISKYSLDAHIVSSRIVYEIENKLLS